jgi:hypothetical protein
MAALEIGDSFARFYRAGLERIRNPHLLELYDNLSQGAGANNGMRGLNVRGEKAFFVKKWPELASFNKRGRLGKYLAVVHSAIA